MDNFWVTSEVLSDYSEAFNVNVTDGGVLYRAVSEDEAYMVADCLNKVISSAYAGTLARRLKNAGSI